MSVNMEKTMLGLVITYKSNVVYPCVSIWMSNLNRVQDLYVYESWLLFMAEGMQMLMEGMVVFPNSSADW